MFYPDALKCYINEQMKNVKASTLCLKALKYGVFLSLMAYIPVSACKISEHIADYIGIMCLLHALAYRFMPMFDPDLLYHL